MLRVKKGHEFDARRVGQKVNEAAAAAIHTSLVGNQADALASQRRKALRLENVEAGVHRERSLCGAREGQHRSAGGEH